VTARPAFPPPVPPRGLFGPGSVMWKINQERVILLGGPTAAVLQVAHPQVARGVAEHSRFKSNAYARLTRTLEAIYAISFGNDAEVLRVANMVHKIHRHVKNREGEPAYSALDDDLQLWVLATLVTGATFCYERFVGPLSEAEKEAYLRDMRVWGEFFGVRRDYGPQSWPGFQEYYHGMINGPLLGSDPICAEVVHHVVYPKRPRLFAAATRPLEFLVTETIPQPLLARLGLASKPWTRTAWSATGRLLPPLYPFIPGILRHPAEYRHAKKLWAP